ncbi:MAG: redox-regulated ATPase YchF [Candidatus Aenigmatarchaeota archaeon]|nr:MAG: redox-regulated ATPase YchF [Candidatus Aenigmarchaeota archaeon]
MLLGFVGVPNSGKSTMLKAATLADVQIASYPFTTIKPNQAVGYVITDCPCKRLNVTCNPQNSKCVSGRRWIPVKILDVAGLVPGAHEGKGLGNKFLDDLRQADGLVHVLDASGLTDSEGKQRTEDDLWDPGKNILVLEGEIDEWLSDIIQKNIEKVETLARMKKVPIERLLGEKLSGLGIGEDDIKRASAKTDMKSREFATMLRRESKPIITAANKIDKESAKKNYDSLKSKHEDMIPTSADLELALREAAEHGLIEYMPGDSDFRIISEELNEKQKSALDFIKNGVLKDYGSTGVQKVLNGMVFDKLQYITVYPVASIGRLTDSKGNVLPDAYLVKKGTKLKEFAAKVHSTMADKFIGGLDLGKKKLGADHELKDGDVVEIIFSK